MEAPSFSLLTDLGALRERVARVTAECTDPKRPSGRAFSFDIESGYHGEPREKASLHPEENFVAGISLTNSRYWSCYSSVAHDPGPNLNERDAAEVLYPLFVEARAADGTPLAVPHGGKFDLRTLRRWFNRLLGTNLTYQDFRLRSDSMLESYALGSSRRHGLKELTEEQAAYDDEGGFWHKQLEIEDLFENLTARQKKQIRFNGLDPTDPKVLRYVCEDTVYTLAHHRRRYPLLQQELAASPNKGRGFIWKLEMAVLPVVCEMEDEGIFYDWAGMRDGARKARDFAERYLEEIRADFGELRGAPLDLAFNFGSPPQLRKLLYEDCGMPVTHYTRGGRDGKNKQPGTDAKVALKHLSKTYPEVAKYLEWKRIVKLYRDYLEKFEDTYSFAADGRAHASLMQHGVPAGRFACGDPNYQQSPKYYHYTLRDGTEFELNFRDYIGAPPGWYQLGFDLAQAELRAIAGLAQEDRMLRAFEQGIDVHKVTASLLFGVPVEQVTKEQRDVGKTMGLALVYGLTEGGLADRLGITYDEAVDLFAAFHAAYPKIKEWTDRTVRDATDDRYVTTWWGRKVPVWGFADADEAEKRGQRKRSRQIWREAQRTAGNAPVQGSATGDYMKIVMVRTEAALRKAGLKDRVRLAMNVHDELEWYVRNDTDFNDVIAVLEPAVVFPVPGWPPLVAEWKAGKRWGSMRELVKAGGRYVFKGTAAAAPDIDLSEEDEDDVAPAPVLPALKEIRVNPEPAAAPHPGTPCVQGPCSEHAGPPRTVIVEPSGGLRSVQVSRLIDFLDRRPGPNTVVLRLPTGDVISVRKSSLCPADEAELSVALGAVRVVVAYDAASVDLGEAGEVEL